MLRQGVAGVLLGLGMLLISLASKISLSAEDEQTIRGAFEGMEIIGVFRFEAGNEASLESAAIEMKKALDILEEKVTEAEK